MNKVAFGAIAISLVLLLGGCSSGTAQPKPTSSTNSQVDAQARALLPKDILKSGVLRIATDATYAPNEFVDRNKLPVGWEVELIRKVAQRLGLKADVHNVTFDAIFGQLNDNLVDVGISSFFDTRDREVSVDMIDYYRAGTQWGQRTGSKVDPNNACGLRIAVQRDSYQFDTDLPARSAECVKNGRAAIKIEGYATQDDATESVTLADAVAFVSDSPVTQFAVLKSGGALTTAGEVYDASFYGMPVKKGSPLIPALTKALQGLIDHDTYRQILAAWGVQQGAIATIGVNQGN